MKKNKLHLKDLSVHSFVTNMSQKENITIEGAAEGGVTISDGVIQCAVSQIKHICLTYEITEGAVSIASIVTSIIRSAKTDCAAATRAIVNCDDTFSPCKV